MAHYRQLITDQIRTVQGQKDYCLSVLRIGGLEHWESKEYRALVEQYDQTLFELQSRLPLADSDPLPAFKAAKAGMGRDEQPSAGSHGE